MSDDNKLPIEQSPEVRAALDRLYPLLRAPKAGRRVNRWIDGMHSAEQCAALEAAGSRKPVKELTDAEFAHLAWHAACWDGEHPDTLTYFLPRVLDEHFSFVSTAVPIGMFAGNLREGGWPAAWSDAQRAAVADVMSAALLGALAVEGDRCDHPPPAWEVLWLTAALRLDVGVLLDRWRQTRTVPAAVQLATFLQQQIALLDPPYADWWDGVWDGERIEPGVQQQVARWLLSAETAAQLEEAFFAATDRRTQALLSNAQNLFPP